MSPKTFKSFRTLTFILPLFFSIPLVRGVEPEKKISLTEIEKRMNSMQGILKAVLIEVADARNVGDLRKVNCLVMKLNAVKGLVRASENAHIVMLEATYDNDPCTTQSFAKKIVTYSDSLDEIAKSLDECSGAGTKSDGTTVVYIRPDETEPIIQESSPWNRGDNVGGADPYPVAPPASPYR
jgi:hypothetical protein